MKICPHDGTVDVPGFVHLDAEARKSAMHYVTCHCKLTGWWSKIDIEGYYREDYPAYRCQDCKRVTVVNSFNAKVQLIKILDKEDY